MGMTLRNSIHKILLVTLLIFAWPAISSPFASLKPGQPIPADRFINLAKLINPSVVNIYTSQNARPHGPPQGSPFHPNDPLQDLFEQFFRGQNPQNRPVQSLGTGFIIRKDGLILTNHHVIDKADSIKVQISEDDTEQYDAVVIGKDARSDIALIKIKSKKSLQAVQFGSSAKTEVGEWVAAFGNPFGHGHSMTKGIVSAIGREISELNRFPFIQTDASINQGNSGGPLVNLAGEVIGVNSAVDARAQGIGFAIPIDRVKKLIPILEKNGVVQRGFIGLYLEDLSEKKAKALGIRAKKGALVTQVMPKGPAERAGIRPYDVIINFAGSEIESSRDLVSAVADRKPKSTAKVVVVREQKRKTLKVTVGFHPEDKVEKPVANKKVKGKSFSKYGFKLSPYTSKLAQQYNLPKLKKERVVVVEVEPDSSASRAGLSEGDIILEVNRKSIANSRQMKRALRSNNNVFRVLRGEQAVILILN